MEQFTSLTSEQLAIQKAASKYRSNNIQKAQLSDLLMRYYLPYAKTTIIGRAIPAIDGLKPVQRRVLYTMYKLGLFDKRIKSHKVVGDTMKYHPNGDAAIYDSLGIMTESNETLNYPYINGKGNFSKTYAQLQGGAMRYTEAGLAKFCKDYVFDGINEDAVDMIPNFDNTDLEPVLLPVKFPTILVNATDGVAVGFGTATPSFSLYSACRAAKAMAQGLVTKPEDLLQYLGAPSFSTGGTIHCDDKSLIKLYKDKKATFKVTGFADYSRATNTMTITELPHGVTVEELVDSITSQMKLGHFKGVKKVHDEIGLEGLRITIELKSNNDLEEFKKELLLLTPFRTSVTFRNNVIIDNEYRELSVYELLKEWMKFRENCIIRQYKYKLNKATTRKHLVEAWGMIKDDVTPVATKFSQIKNAEAREYLKTTYGMDDDQATFIVDDKAITRERADKYLNELDELNARVEYCTSVINNSSERNKIIISELDEVLKFPNGESKTRVSGLVFDDDITLTKHVATDEPVAVVLTKKGFLKRLVSASAMSGRYAYGDDYEVQRFNMRNNEYLLVFDRFGTAHKILADDIDSSRSAPHDKLSQLAKVEKDTDIIFVDAAGDYSGGFNLIYNNGRGTIVRYAKLKNGKRDKYKIGYNEVVPGSYFITKENQFFILTHNRSAAYMDLGIVLGFERERSKNNFKIATLKSNDYVVALALYKNTPNKSFINLDRYKKPYTVRIGDDVLYSDVQDLIISK